MYQAHYNVLTRLSDHPQTPGEAGKKTRKRVFESLRAKVAQLPPPPPPLVASAPTPPKAASSLPKPLAVDALVPAAPGGAAALMASSDFNTEPPEVSCTLIQSLSTITP